MNDRQSFESRSEGSFPEPTGVNRILRFDVSSSLATADAMTPERLTQVPGLDLPHRLCLPANFESSYAYPLIVWLHDDGGDADEIDELLPRISERNYLAVALQGNLLRAVGRGWSTAEDRMSQIQTDLHQLVESVEDQCRIHWDRMYLAGFGVGGSLAWEILLREPTRWAGAISLSGDFPKMKHPLAMFRELQQRRLLVSTGLDCPSQQVSQLINSGRLMYSAGLEVGTRIYETGCKSPTDKMLRDVDRWIMDSISTAVR